MMSNLLIYIFLTIVKKSGIQEDPSKTFIPTTDPSERSQCASESRARWPGHSTTRRVAAVEAEGWAGKAPSLPPCWHTMSVSVRCTVHTADLVTAVTRVLNCHVSKEGGLRNPVPPILISFSRLKMSFCSNRFSTAKGTFLFVRYKHLLKVSLNLYTFFVFRQMLWLDLAQPSFQLGSVTPTCAVAIQDEMIWEMCPQNNHCNL